MVCEIGVHRGHVLSELARKFPDYGFVGLDITYKRVVCTAEKLLEANASNGLSVFADANHIDRLFAPGELDGILIFFPDPWSKKQKQKKNQLLSGPFTAKLSSCLKPGGWVWLKTDSKDYFVSASKHFADAGFSSPAQTPFAACSPSVFEQRFKRRGISICEGIWSLPKR